MFRYPYRDDRRIRRRSLLSFVKTTDSEEILIRCRQSTMISVLNCTYFSLLSIVRFEWDEQKAEVNRRRHGISFSEAREVFDDPLHLSVLDERFDYFRERWITVGQTRGPRIVVVVNLSFDDDGEDVIRIISAREATPSERRQYEQDE